MFTALLDTCVLVPSLQRDVLLQCAAAGVYRPVWSTAILEELSYTLTRRMTARDRSEDEVNAYVTRLCRQMRRAFPDATVTGWEGLLPAITVPDPDDAHVAAAAITADAGVIVTSDQHGFTSGLSATTRVRTPDEFPLDALDLPRGWRAKHASSGTAWNRLDPLPAGSTNPGGVLAQKTPPAVGARV